MQAVLHIACPKVLNIRGREELWSNCSGDSTPAERAGCSASLWSANHSHSNAASCPVNSAGDNRRHVCCSNSTTKNTRCYCKHCNPALTTLLLLAACQVLLLRGLHLLFTVFQMLLKGCTWTLLLKGPHVQAVCSSCSGDDSGCATHSLSASAPATVPKNADAPKPMMNSLPMSRTLKP